jgi:uncharacterized membrane protein
MESAKRFIFWVSLISLFVVIGFISIFVTQSSRLDWNFSDEPNAYLNFGLLIGALLTPLIALSSVLLLWLTLRVQMEELRKSNESLQRTSEATERVLEQEQKLFEYRLLDEYLKENADNLVSLTTISFIFTDDEFQYVVETNVSEKVAHIKKEFHELFDPKNSFDFFVDALTHDHNRIFEKCLYEIRAYGIDVLRYYRCGGSLRHILKQLKIILYLTGPFSEYELELTKIADKYKLHGLVKQLSKLHTELSQAQEFSDLLITGELYREK